MHSNHIFKANYLLEYNSINDFVKNFTSANNTGGFDKYISYFKFLNNYIEELTDYDNKNLGLIYNIEKAPQAPVPPGPIPSYQDPNKPPLIGLKNVGATCYMNATLQCLSQILHLAYYFKTNPQINNTIKNKNIKKKIV